MKRAIEITDIRKGDTILREWMGTTLTMTVHQLQKHLAYSAEGYCMGLDDSDDVQFYLLDRPEPAVELPNVPTLGWVEHEEIKAQFGSWVASGATLYAVRQMDFDAASVTAFAPATAVPNDALDALRFALDEAERMGGYASGMILRGATQTFLAAVDAANGNA